MGAQRAVGIDRVGISDERQQRDVVGRVAVGGAAFQVEVLRRGEGLDGRGLGRAVQRLAHQPAGVDAADRLGDRAERAAQAQPPRDDGGGLHRGGRDQPHALARVQVGLGERPRARPDAAGHVLVVDLLADRHEFGDAVPGDDRERAVPRVRHVPRVLRAGQPEVRLLPGELHQLALAEELALVQAAAQVEDRRALHHGVVQVEERRGLRVARGRELRLGRGLAGGLGGRLAGQLAAFGGHPLAGGEPGPAGAGRSGIGRGRAGPGHAPSIATARGDSGCAGMTREWPPAAQWAA